MTRRRGLLGAVAVVALVAVVAVVLLAGRGGSSTSTDATRYAQGWDDACRALSADARDTTAAIARRTATAADRTAAALRAAAGALAVPYLERTAARLAAVSALRPPPRWAAYHRLAVVALQEARRRTDVVAGRVRTGDVSALSTLDLGAVGRSPVAPADLARRTPACTGGAA